MAELLSKPRQLVMAVALVLLAGCAGVPRQASEEAAECRALFKQVDAAVDKYGVRDHGPVQVPDFPYLRMTRLLASFRDEVEAADRFAAWSRHMAVLDAQARGFELSNLATLVAGMDAHSLSTKLDGCRDHLMATELAQPEMRERLREAAQIPDAYVTWWRVAGLYPLTVPLVSSGIARWHNETHEIFAKPLNQLPITGTLTRWIVPKATPLENSQVRSLLNHQHDPLGLPILTSGELQQLFATFAPIWEVDVASDDDRIGAPYWSRKSTLAVNIGQPVVYQQLSHTRFDGMVLLQLNYIVWFPARPGDDLYSGVLDGINWRVTLGPDGTPWLFDAMHNCGCYHQFFPTSHLRLRNDLSSAYSEMPLQPQAAPNGHPLILRIAHSTHYIQRVYQSDKSEFSTLLSWRDYDALRALPSPGGTRSLFGEYGLVEESKRAERYLLWPMGVRSAGAMRQWGQHATAFIGRRHFDEAHLLDMLFERTAAP